jgi:hypothetical protein
MAPELQDWHPGAVTLKHRKAMFERGSAALHATVPSLHGLYACPLCLGLFPSEEVEDGGELSEEHAPPQSLGGQVVCLTCRDCNNSAGFRLDTHMQRREAHIDFATGTDSRELNAQFTIEGVTQRGVISMSGGAIRAVGVPRRDHPAVPGRMMEALDALAGSERTDWSVQVQFQDRWIPRRAHVGWLRSAYLVAFAALGYRYILRDTLRRVADQIASPDTDVIPLPVVSSPMGDPSQSSALLVEEPSDLVSVLIQMGRNTVLLPGIDDNETFFERMDGVIRDSGPNPQQVVHGKLLPWPTRMAFLLDAQASDGDGGSR